MIESFKVICQQAELQIAKLQGRALVKGVASREGREHHGYRIPRTLREVAYTAVLLYVPVGSNFFGQKDQPVRYITLSRT